LLKKVTHKPLPGLFPVPTVLVTSKTEESRPNIITIAWTGIMNSAPPVVYIGVNPIRYSHGLIQQSGEYVINIPSTDQVLQVDFCGLESGRTVDKFAATGFTAVPATYVKAPLISECPVNIECRVRQTLNLESHDVFIADVLAVHYNESVLDGNGRPNLERIKPYGYCMGEYHSLSGKIGQFGFSKTSKN
jgi:flavin reductase (DIM6/NTAB) family NADH-FMN oxidoreductase RutF